MSRQQHIHSGILDAMPPWSQCNQKQLYGQVYEINIQISARKDELPEGHEKFFSRRVVVSCNLQMVAVAESETVNTFKRRLDDWSSEASKT